MILIILILMIALLCFKYYEMENFATVKLNDIKIDHNTTIKIRQILKTINTLFNNYGITYWADCGTLLGMVRHGDIIPWDDDGDVSIFKKDEQQFLYLEPVFNEFGYGIAIWWGGYKIFPLDGQVTNETKRGQTYNYRYPFVDIFIMNYDEENGIIKYDDDKLVKIWPNAYHNANQLFPLQQYKFHDFYLWGPNNCSDYLERSYGNDWLNVAYLQYDHKNGKHLSRQKFKLEDIE